MKKLVLLVAMFTVSVNLFARNTSVDAVTAASEYVDDKFRFVDAGGRMIADGAEITITKVTQETDDFTGERTDILYDGISLKNTASGTWNAKIKYKIEQIPSGMFQICWGICRPHETTGEFQTMATLEMAGGEVQSLQTEWVPQLNVYGTCKVTYQVAVYRNSDESFYADGHKITVIYKYGSSTDIENVLNQGNSSDVELFSIDGSRLSAPKKGINIVKMNDGTVVKRVVR